MGAGGYDLPPDTPVPGGTPLTLQVQLCRGSSSTQPLTLTVQAASALQAPPGASSGVAQAGEEEPQATATGEAVTGEAAANPATPDSPDQELPGQRGIRQPKHLAISGGLRRCGTRKGQAAAPPLKARVTAAARLDTWSRA